MKKFLFVLFGSLCLLSFSVFSQYNNDSVIDVGVNVLPIPTQSSAGNSNGSPIVSLSSNEYQYGTCPAGFTYNGSSQFPLQVRTVTTNYSNGAYVGTITSAWYDMDADCSTTEYQQIACPTNYTGVYYQSRQVTTSDTGYDYGAWTTYGNNCVYNPPQPAYYSQDTYYWYSLLLYTGSDKSISSILIGSKIYPESVNTNGTLVYSFVYDQYGGKSQYLLAKNGILYYVLYASVNDPSPYLYTVYSPNNIDSNIYSTVCGCWGAIGGWEPAISY